MVVMSSHNGEMHLLVNDKENYPIYYSKGSSGFLSVWIKINYIKNGILFILYVCT